MILPQPFLLGLCFAAALCYVLAVLILKSGAGGPWLAVLVAVAAANGLGAWLEGLVLREAGLVEAFFLILAFEILLLAAVAVAFFGERYGAREVFGMLLILAGVALVQPGSTPAPGLATGAPAPGL